MNNVDILVEELRKSDKPGEIITFSDGQTTVTPDHSITVNDVITGIESGKLKWVIPAKKFTLA